MPTSSNFLTAMHVDTSRAATTKGISVGLSFHNATSGREDFWGRKLGRDEAFTEAEDREL